MQYECVIVFTFAARLHDPRTVGVAPELLYEQVIVGRHHERYWEQIQVLVGARLVLFGQGVAFSF